MRLLRIVSEMNFNNRKQEINQCEYYINKSSNHIKSFDVILKHFL
jgi:antitoxin component YwqK of YwqJK toxin-antitoxin module